MRLILSLTPSAIGLLVFLVQLLTASLLMATPPSYSLDFARDGALEPSSENPFYWSRQGQPVLLIGGSREDNVFQIPEIEEHLDLLAASGGNYIRCTMSSRDPGDEWPFERDPATGLYDLERPSAEYWRRFELCRDLARERGIVLQIEVWDRFDYSRAPWLENPFNPKNNLNYTSEESGLPEEIREHPGARRQPFFHTIPAMQDNALVRRFQEIHVNELLARTLGQPHILFCIDNETNEDAAWPRYWADFIHAQAKARGVNANVTEMWDDHNLMHDQHTRTWQDPDRFLFCDVSQNNQQYHEQHWENFLAFRQMIIETGRPRPLNTVKTYGANTGYYGTTREGQERFWRHFMAGAASMRFHRPDSGLGLGPVAQANIRSLRMFSNAFPFWKGVPAPDLLLARARNEAYANSAPGEYIAVYFPDGGDVSLDLRGLGNAPIRLRWLNIRESAWGWQSKFPAAERMRLETPAPEGYWAALLTPVE